MKKLIATLTCAALLAAPFATGVSAAAVDGAKLVTSADAAAAVKLDLEKIDVEALDALLTACNLPITAEAILTGFATGAYDFASLELMLASLDPAVAAQITQIISAAIIVDEEAAVEEEVKEVEIILTEVPKYANIIMGDSNVTGLVEVVTGAPVEGTFAVKAHDKMFGETVVFAANGATSDTIYNLFADEEQKATLNQVLANASTFTVNIGGNDYLQALAGMTDDLLNIRIPTDTAILSQAIQVTAIPEGMPNELFVMLIQVLYNSLESDADFDIASIADIDVDITSQDEAGALALKALADTYYTNLAANVEAISAERAATFYAEMNTVINAAATVATTNLINNLNAITEYAISVNPDLKISFMGIPQIDMDKLLLLADAEQSAILTLVGVFVPYVIDNINATIDAYLSENAAFIDINPALEGVEDAFIVDGIHLSEAGHEAVGKLVNKAVRTYKIKADSYSIMIAGR